MSDVDKIDLTPEEQTDAVSGPDRPVITYITIGLVVISIAILIYFAYKSFVNKADDGECDDEEGPAEKDEAITDFNLRDAITNLQEIQKRVMRTLSDASNI
jgi:hypothetical protein